MPINYDRQILSGIANRYKQLAAQMLQSQEDAVKELNALNEVLRGLDTGTAAELKVEARATVSLIVAVRQDAIRMAGKIEQYAARLGM